MQDRTTIVTGSRIISVTQRKRTCPATAGTL